MSDQPVILPFDFGTLAEVYRQYDTGVYGIVNASRASAYVGTAPGGFHPRWNIHHQALMSGYHPMRLLQQHWRTDGPHAFKFVILQELSPAKPMRHYQHFWMEGFAEAEVLCYNLQEPVLADTVESWFVAAAKHAVETSWQTTQEAMHMLRCSRPTIYRLIAQGKLPAVRVGAHWRFDPDDVLRALAQAAD